MDFFCAAQWHPMLQGFKKLETDQNRQDFGSASCVAMGLAEAQGLPCLPIR